MIRQDNAGPFLRWAGSKKQLLSKLLSYWDNRHERYIEPFMGSASLFFAIQPRKAILSDINSELVETFIAVRDNPDKVYRSLIEIPRGRDSYYRVRAQATSELDSIARAARFIFLNRFCFNGLYRTNKAGRFNVPFSFSKTGDLPTRLHLEACASFLLSADLRCGDFEKVLLDEVRAGDFVYLDPPYAISNHRIFLQYGPQTFGVTDIQRLKRVLNVIEGRGVNFVLSYASCAEALEAFGTWDIKEVFVRRNIAGFVKDRRLAKELIFSNCSRLRHRSSRNKKVYHDVTC